MRPITATLLLVCAGPAAADDDFREIKGHGGPVRVVRYTPDGTKLVSVTGWPKGDETIRVWDAKTGKELKKITGFKKEIDGMALSPDGKKAVTGGHDNTAKVWDLENGKLLHSLEGHKEQVPGVAFRPDGKMIASGSHDKSVKLWDAETGKLIKTLDGHTKEVRCCLFSADGKKLITGGRDQTVIVWDPDTGKQLKTWQCDDTVHNLALVPKANDEVAIGHDRLSRYNLTTGEEVSSLRGDQPVECLAISPDGSKAATGTFGGEMRIWNLKTGKELARYTAHVGACWWLDFSPDGKALVSGGGGGFTNGNPDPGTDFAIRVWTVEE
jgi:WD40 repeat protein